MTSEVTTPPAWVRLVARVCRRLPAGRYRLIHHWCPRPATPFWAKLPSSAGAMEFVCDLRDSVGREICFTGQYEPQETAVVRRLLRPGMTVVDVGANWGYYTLLAAHLVGSSGRVVSLEPHPMLHEWLERNVARNRLPQVTTLRLAAADRTGALPLKSFNLAGGNYGVSEIREQAGSEADGAVDVPVCDLDTVLERLGLDTIDLMKMDVEGAEGLALAGLRRALARSAIRYVLLELHPAALATRGITATQVVGPLVAAGYTGWRIDHSPGATRRAAYRRDPPIDRLLRPADGATSEDAWPHMLWTACNQSLFAV